MKLQLIFPKHEEGKSLAQGNIPPLGLLTIASYIRKKHPKIDIEVLDENSITEEGLLHKIGAEFIGISVWFSNYHNGILLAKKIKEHNPETKIILGGPNTNQIAEKILKRNAFIDFVITGDGERGILELLENKEKDKIPGLSYRKGNRVINNPPDYSLELNNIPLLNLDLLKTPFKWDSKIERKGHSYFAISRYRGCFRINRCQYCSIPFKSTRKSSPQIFWKEITSLNKEYGIDCFFETADTFPLMELENILKHRPKNLGKIAIRCYIAPSTTNEIQIRLLSKIGIKQVFIGVENSRFYADTKCAPISFKRYPDRYSTENLIKEIKLFAKYGIDVMPSYVLGMPGETKESLKENLNLIIKIAKEDNVKEMSVNMCLPLPGSNYFLKCIEDEQIIKEYLNIKNQNLRNIDDLDIHFLSKLFIKRYSSVSYEDIVKEVEKFMNNTTKSVAHWGM